MERAKVRVDFGDEVSWAEHIEENVYRSLNNTFSNVPLRLPPEHEHASRNGQLCNMQWGHLFEATVIRAGLVQPVCIVGMQLED